jgi:WD40 repeat protein
LDAVRIAAGISNSAALRGVALAAHALPDLRFERELPYGDEFTLRSVDPSFKRIALSGGRGPVEIRSTTNQSLLATLAPSTNLPAYAADWSPDGRYLAIKRDYPPSGASSDKEVWDLQTGEQSIVLHDAPFSSISFHPRLPRVLVGRPNGAAVWDLKTRVEVSRLELHRTPLLLRYSPDGEQFAASFSAEGGWLVSLHRVHSGEMLSSNVFDTFVGSFNWHPSGRWLAVPDYGSSVSRFDAETGEKRLLGRHKTQATRVEFSPDGAYLMSGGWDRELLCWDARTLQRPLSIWLNGYVGWFSADGQKSALRCRWPNIASGIPVRSKVGRTTPTTGSQRSRHVTSSSTERNRR